MKRIAVIGAGGAGKTRLACALGQALGLPVIHLDLYYCGPSWQPLPSAEWVDRQRQLAAAERWVMDGNHASTLDLHLERADMAVFLDLPPLLCVWRVMWRCAFGHLVPAHDLPPDLRPKLGRRFLVYVLTFRHRQRAALLAQLAAWDGEGPAVHLHRDERSGDLSPARLTLEASEHKFG